MGEREILGFLESNPNKYFKSKQISAKLGVDDRAVRESLRKMKEYRIVDVKATGKHNCNLFKWKF